MQMFIPITKVDVLRGEVYGVAAEQRTDRAMEKFDYAGSKPYFEEWSAEVQKDSQGKSLGNVRAQHGTVAAGKVIALNFDDAGKNIEVGTKIVDHNELQKVLEGVYTGFSIGGKYVLKFPDPDEPGVTRYVAKPSEISIVDRPCMYGATFQTIKGDGQVEMRKFVGSEATREEEPTDATAFVDGKVVALPTTITVDADKVAKVGGVPVKWNGVPVIEDSQVHGIVFIGKGDAGTRDFYGNQHANGSSRVAHSASGKAFASGAPEDHEKAAEEHRKASKHHAAVGNKTKANYHETMAVAHDMACASAKADDRGDLVKWDEVDHPRNADGKFSGSESNDQVGARYDKDLGSHEFKGWDQKDAKPNYNKASTATRKANEATRAAKSPEDHRKAAELHREAAKQHTALAERHHAVGRDAHAETSLMAASNYNQSAREHDAEAAKGSKKAADRGDLDKIHRPHRIKRDGKYKVVDDDGKVYGEHDTRDKANQQLAALYAAKEKESKTMTAEMQKAVCDRFVKLALERGWKVPEAVQKDSLGALDWIGSLKTRQAARGLYIIGQIELLQQSEMFEGADHEAKYPEQNALLEDAKARLQEWVPTELAEDDEPEEAAVAVAAPATSAPMAMADHVAAIGEVLSKADATPEDIETITKALGDRLKALVHKGNHQEVHDHCVKAFGSKCAKAGKVDEPVDAPVKKADEVKCPECDAMVEPDDKDECPECGADLSDVGKAAPTEGVEKVELVAALAAQVPSISDLVKAEVATIQALLKAEFAAEREDIDKAAGEERAKLQTQVATLEARVEKMSKRVAEKNGINRPVQKGGEGAGVQPTAPELTPSEKAVPIIKQITAQFGQEIGEAVALKLGEALIAKRQG